MSTDLLPLYTLVGPFLLVLFRLLGLIAFVPFFSTSWIPGNVKVLLGLAITLCIWNVVPDVQSMGPKMPESLPALIVAIAGEMTVGLVIGMILGAVFAGIQLGSHMISQQMGLSLATLYDPAFEDQSTVIEQIAFWIAMVAFLSFGGHRDIIDCVVYSYQKIPVGSGGISPEIMLNTLLGAMDASMHAATRIAMPGLAAFFIATLTSGLLSRSMPQLNLMTIGISLNLIVGFVMVMAGMTGWALVSRDALTESIHVIARVVGGVKVPRGNPMYHDLNHAK